MEEKTEVASSSSHKKYKPMRAPGPIYHGTLKYAVRTLNKALFGVKKSNSSICLMEVRKMMEIPRKPRNIRINLGEIAGYMITESEKDEIVKREREEMLKEQKQERLKREKELKKPIKESNVHQLFDCRHEKRRRFFGNKINDDQEIKEVEEVNSNSCRPKTKPYKKPTRKFMAGRDEGPDPPPQIPPEFLQKIRSLNGCGEKLVIQKRLFKTDVEGQQHRFSIPLTSIRDDTFLTPGEVKLLNTRIYNPVTKKTNPWNMPVVFIDPRLKKMSMNFRLWEYKKDDGRKPSSWSYVFVSKWMEVVNNNELERGHVVQVWAFRVEGKLCFAMNVLGKNGEEEQVKEDREDE